MPLSSLDVLPTSVPGPRSGRHRSGVIGASRINSSINESSIFYDDPPCRCGNQASRGRTTRARTSADTSPLPDLARHLAASNRVAPVVITSSTRITGLPANMSRYLFGTLNMPATFFCAVRVSARPDFYYGSGVAAYLARMCLPVPASTVLGNDQARHAPMAAHSGDITGR